MRSREPGKRLHVKVQNWQQTTNAFDGMDILAAKLLSSTNIITGSTSNFHTLQLCHTFPSTPSTSAPKDARTMEKMGVLVCPGKVVPH